MPELNVCCGYKKNDLIFFPLYIILCWRNNSETEPVFIFSGDTLENPWADHKTGTHFGKQKQGTQIYDRVAKKPIQPVH